MSPNERIKQVRKALGLTQMKFAERTAISTSYLAGMELGDKKVNERIIRLIGAEFGVDEHWLRTGDGTMYNAETDVKVAKLMSLFTGLNPKFQECALKQLDELAELQNILAKQQ